MQSDDRIGDELARAVIGHLPSPLDSFDGDALRLELCGTSQDVRRVRVPAEGQNGRVLQQEKLIRDASGETLVNKPFLERVRSWVLDPAEPAGMERQRRAERPGLWFGERRLHARTIAGVPCSAVRRTLQAQTRGWPKGTGRPPPTGLLQIPYKPGSVRPLTVSTRRSDPH